MFYVFVKEIIECEYIGIFSDGELVDCVQSDFRSIVDRNYNQVNTLIFRYF